MFEKYVIIFMSMGVLAKLIIQFLFYICIIFQRANCYHVSIHVNFSKPDYMIHILFHLELRNIYHFVIPKVYYHLFSKHKNRLNMPLASLLYWQL